GARKTEEQAKQTAGKAAEGALKAALGLVSSATIIVLVIALGAFLVHEPDSYRRGVRHLIPTRYQEKFDETWRRAARSLRPLLGYLVVHVIEGYIVDPLVMKRAVHIKPTLLLFFQAVAGAVFGVTGTVVATPLLVCIQEVVQYLWVQRVRS